MKHLIILSITFLALASFCQAEIPDFGPNGLKNLSKKQIDKLNKGNILFSTTDKSKQKNREKKALIEAVLVFDTPIDETWKLLSKTEDQINYLKEIKEIKIINETETDNINQFKIKAPFFTIIYRVHHIFDKPNRYFHWTLDPNFENDLEDLRGFWRFYPYGDNKTLVRYGSRVALKSIPDWIEAMFKKGGVRKSLKCVKKYVESGGTWHH